MPTSEMGYKGPAYHRHYGECPPPHWGFNEQDHCTCTCFDWVYDLSVLFYLYVIINRASILPPGYEFGRRQIGKQVWDVTLPPWCLNDPRLMIMTHRQALESAYVTQHLPVWINLVFGHQQKGKSAVDAINVFHPAVSKWRWRCHIWDQSATWACQLYASSFPAHHPRCKYPIIPVLIPYHHLLYNPTLFNLNYSNGTFCFLKLDFRFWVCVA